MRMASLRSVVVWTILGVATCAAQCPDISSCLGLSSGASCTYVYPQNQSAVCGTCATRGSCQLACEVKADQSTCALPTCTKAATGPGGLGITSPCGTTRTINGDMLKEPKEFVSSAGSLNLTMNVKLVNWNATAFTITTRLYCVSASGSSVETCSHPAPTIRVKPGDTLTVVLQNSLGIDNSSTAKPMNSFRTPNYINVHTHGLHVDPSIDNVMIHLMPGETHTYTYSIPSDHFPGNHWYHSHVHGSSTMQVAGGMAGMLIVDPPTTWTAPAAYSAMAVTKLIFTHLSLCSCNPTSDPFSYLSYVAVRAASGDVTPMNYVQQSGFTETDIMLTNGQYQPWTGMQPGEWRRFDMTNAVGDVYLELEVRTAVAGGTTACSMVLLSLDGVMLRATRNVTMVPVPPAGRVSVAVMCAAAGTYYLHSNPQQRAADYEAVILQNLLTLQVSGSTQSMTMPSWSTAAFTYPVYLTDLSATTAAVSFEVGVDQTLVPAPAGAWLGIGANCSDSASGRAEVAVDPNTYGNCAYQPFSSTGSYRFAAPGCSVVDMTINGRGKTPHPIHLHVHAFQVISSVGTTPYTSVWGALGDFRDTFPAVQGRSKVRFAATGWQGAVMMHCHLLKHEDMGMMDRWWTGTATSSACVATSISNMCNSSVPAAAFATTFTPTPLTCDAFSTGSPTSTVATTTSSATTTRAPIVVSSSVTMFGSLSPWLLMHLALLCVISYSL